nr:class I SAM-dependent methyltransferase [Shouchella clausii]
MTMNQKLNRKINNLEKIKRPSADELFQFISLHKEDTLLDLGAGAGYISLPISKYVDEVIALDFDEEMLKYLEMKAKEQSITNIKTLVSDFKDIQLDDEKVDKAVASISLHEVKPLSLALGEIYRVLKSKGVFLCIELEEAELSTGPRVSSEKMKEEILRAGFDIVQAFYLQAKVANQPVYIIVAQKND